MRFLSRVIAGLLIIAGLSLFNPQNVLAQTQQSNQAGLFDHSIYLPGELLVKFKDSVAGKLPAEIKSSNLPTGSNSLNQLNSKYGITGGQRIFDHLKNQEASRQHQLSNIYRLNLPKNADIKKVAAEYRKDPNVLWAEPNSLNFTLATPNDTDYNLQWGLNNAGDHDIDAPEAWDIRKAENGVPVPTVAIIDTGVDLDHADLAANIVSGYDFVETTCLNPGDCTIDGYDLICTDSDCTVEDNDPNDSNGHGTMCSGVAGAVTHNSAGVAGVSGMLN